MRVQSINQNPKSRFAAPTAFLFFGVALFGPLPFIDSAANAQMVVMPGQTYDNIPAAGKVIQNPAPADPDTLNRSCNAALVSPVGYINCRSGTAVAFARQDANTQLIYVYANGWLGSTVARGILFVDFCVPRPGAATCDTVSDPNAPDITVRLTFQYGAIGAAETTFPLTDAKLALTGSVVDTEKGGFVAIQDLLGNQLSSHGVQFSPISIDWVPVPLPGFNNATITQPATFPAILLKRGRIYRFQLSAAATADYRAIVDAYTSGLLNCSFSAGCDRGRLMLRNLTITVSQDIGDLTSQLGDLRSAVSSLQQQMGNLVNRIDDLETSLQNSVSALNAAVQSLTARRGREREHDEREEFREGHR